MFIELKDPYLQSSGRPWGLKNCSYKLFDGKSGDQSTTRMQKSLSHNCQWRQPGVESTVFFFLIKSYHIDFGHIFLGFSVSNSVQILQACLCVFFFDFNQLTFWESFWNFLYFCLASAFQTQWEFCKRLTIITLFHIQWNPTLC